MGGSASFQRSWYRDLFEDCGEFAEQVRAPPARGSEAAAGAPSGPSPCPLVVWEVYPPQRLALLPSTHPCASPRLGAAHVQFCWVMSALFVVGPTLMVMGLLLMARSPPQPPRPFTPRCLPARCAARPATQHTAAAR